MTPLILLAVTAATASSTCAMAPDASRAVSISATVLSLEAVGGSYVPGISWPAPGEPRVGSVRYNWGLMLRSADRRFVDFDLSPGSIHSRSSGCWFEWDAHWGEHGIDAISKPRIGESGYLNGYRPAQPAHPPHIAGYRLVMADKAYSPDYAWVGLWVAKGGTKRTQVIAFDDNHRKLVATLPFRLGAIGTMPSPDTPALGITLVGEGKHGRPVPYLGLVWMSGMREGPARPNAPR